VCFVAHQSSTSPRLKGRSFTEQVSPSLWAGKGGQKLIVSRRTAEVHVYINEHETVKNSDDEHHVKWGNLKGPATVESSYRSRGGKKTRQWAKDLVSPPGKGELKTTNKGGKRSYPERVRKNQKHKQTQKKHKKKKKDPTKQ